MHRKESNKRIIINDSDKRKTETLKKAKQQLEQVIPKEERKEVGNMAFITKKGEIEEDLDFLDLPCSKLKGLGNALSIPKINYTLCYVFY